MSYLPISHRKGLLLEEGTRNLLPYAAVATYGQDPYGQAMYGSQPTWETQNCIVEQQEDRILVTGQAPAQSTFTRATNAFLDGAESLSGVPRYPLGRNLMPTLESSAFDGTVGAGFVPSWGQYAGVVNPSVVAGESGGTAQRFEWGSGAARLMPAINHRPPVIPGKSYTITTRVRGKVGIPARLFWKGSVQSGGGETWQGSFTADTVQNETWMTITGIAAIPVDAQVAFLWPMPAIPSGVAGDWLEVDWIQVEEGDAASPWRPGGPSAILIEEGTTNLLPAAQASALTAEYRTGALTGIHTLSAEVGTVKAHPEWGHGGSGIAKNAGSAPIIDLDYLAASKVLWLPGAAGNYASTPDENILIANQASIEQAQPYVSAGSHTLAASTVRSFHGARSLSITFANNTDGRLAHTSPVRVVVGTSYAVSMQVWVPATWTGGDLFLSSEGNNGWSISGAGTTPTPGAWNTVSGTLSGGTANDTLLMLRANTPASLTVGDVIYLDAVCVRAGTDTTFIPSIRITEDIDLRGSAALEDWTPGNDHGLISRRSAYSAEGMAYELLISMDGRLRLQWWDTNAGTHVTADSTVVLGLVDGEPKLVRATLDVNNGAATPVWEALFYTWDGAAWVQLGAAVTGAATAAISASSAILAVGADASNPSATRVKGKLIGAEVRDGIDGPLVAHLRASDFTAPGTTAVDPTGRTWTINRSGDATAEIVDRNTWAFTGSEHLTLPDRDDLDFGADTSFTILTATATRNTLLDKRVFGKRVAGNSYSIYYDNTRGYRGEAEGLGSTPARTASNDGLSHIVGMEVDRGAANAMRSVVDNVFSTGLALGAYSFTNTGMFNIGSMDSNSGWGWRGLSSWTVLFRRTLTAAEHTELTGWDGTVATEPTWLRSAATLYVNADDPVQRAMYRAHNTVINLASGGTGSVLTMRPADNHAVWMEPAASPQRVQLEKKAYKTSWHTGGATRNADILRPPVSTVDPSAGTLELDVVLGADSDIHNRIFELKRSNGLNGFLIYNHDLLSPRAHILHVTSDDGTAATSPVSNPGPGLHRFVVTWEAGISKFYVDGVLIGTVTKALPSAFNEFSLGHSSASLGHGNHTFDNVRASNRARTDAELADWRAPLEADADTTYLMKFEGNLGGEARTASMEVAADSPKTVSVANEDPDRQIVFGTAIVNDTRYGEAVYGKNTYQETISYEWTGNWSEANWGDRVVTDPGDHARVGFRFRNLAEGETRLLLRPQAEDKLYPTSWQHSGRRRSPERLLLPSDSLWSSFTVEIDVEITDFLRGLFGNEDHRYFLHSRNDDCALFRHTDGFLRWVAGSSVDVNFLDIPNGWCRLAVTHDQGVNRLVVNGRLIGETAGRRFEGNPESLALGSRSHERSGQLHHRLGAVRISKRARSAEELSHWETPLQLDVDTTYIVHFDQETLKAERVNDIGAATPGLSDLMPFTQTTLNPTNEYTVFGWVYSSHERTVRVEVHWYDENQEWIRVHSLTDELIVNGERQIAITAVSPEEAAYVSIYFEILDAYTDEEYYLDAVMFERQSKILPYFDAGTSDADYLWQGDPHESPSHFYDRRVVKHYRLSQLIPSYIPAGSTFSLHYAEE